MFYNSNDIILVITKFDFKKKYDIYNLLIIK